MDLPGPAHLIFIPAMLLIGMVIGYVMGQKALRAEIDRKRKRARE
jgi:hypothetical protein